MFKKEMLIDGKGHLLGRLASVVAKEILSGQQVVCDRYLCNCYIFVRLLSAARVLTFLGLCSETT